MASPSPDTLQDSNTLWMAKMIGKKKREYLTLLYTDDVLEPQYLGHLDEMKHIVHPSAPFACVYRMVGSCRCGWHL